MIEGLEQKNISLDKGIVRTPSLGQEGELSECVNLIPHAGEMVRIHEPQPLTEDVTGQYLYYTFVWEKREDLGSNFTLAMAEPVRTDLHITVRYREGEDIQLMPITLPNGTGMVTVEMLYLNRIEDIVEVEVDDEDFMLELPNEGYVGLKAYRLFEFATPNDITFPTEEEQANMPIELQPGELLLETNRCAGKENLIVRNGNTLVYYRPGEGRHVIASLEEGDVEVITIGQTLVVSQGITKRYFLWGEEGYKEQNIADFVPKVELRLGDKGFVPRCIWGKNAPIQSLAWEVGDSDIHITQNSDKTMGTLYWMPKGEGSSSNALTLNQSFWARYNEIRKHFKDSGAHCFPFFVRWGLELYDGSVANLSAPILMMPSSVIRPYIGWLYRYNVYETNITRTGKGEQWTIFFTPRNLYITIDATGLTNIDENLVKGIVVYATPEIEAVDPEHEIFKTGQAKLFEYKSEATKDGLGWDTKYIDVSNSSVTDPNAPLHINYLTYLPVRKDIHNIVDSFNDPIEFYEFASIPWSIVKEKKYRVIASLQEGKLPLSEEGDFIRTTDPVYTSITNQGYLPYNIPLRLDALTSQRQLSDSMATQENYTVVEANTSYSYNSRIIYGGVNLKMPLVIAPTQILANNNLPEVIAGRDQNELSLAVKMGEDYLTIGGSSALTGYKGESSVIAFPHKDANGLAIYEQEGSWAAKVSFQRNKTSLGGYSIWSGITEELIRSSPDIKSSFLSSSEVGEEWFSNSYLDIKPSDLKGNTVAVTKVANPWVIEAVYELACGEIYALTSATEALSEGQFGEFPIYAFTDNGIYALSIAQDGTIGAKQPISRDVLLGMNNTLQIDKAVIYPTKEGLKLISGRNTSLLSASIVGLNVQESGFNAPPELTITDVTPFQEQLEGIKMVYDYAHRRVHLFGEGQTEGKQKHYVYDLESGQWATQILDRQLTTCVAGYPFSTMQFGTQLMQYNNELEADTVKQGWLLTRPISFGDPFTRKMLADIRLMGQKTHADTKFKVQVYISEDRVNWHRLTSLKGRSAKWYRFLIKADMCGLDTLTGISCQYVPRLGSKLR